LKTEIDIVLPLIHGEFGEDGILQKFFEENYIPFIGSSSQA
jgi:D-alanine-D-alanine ligase-like ATP-grasp enzyme